MHQHAVSPYNIHSNTITRYSLKFVHESLKHIKDKSKQTSAFSYKGIIINYEYYALISLLNMSTFCYNMLFPYTFNLHAHF